MSFMCRLVSWSFFEKDSEGLLNPNFPGVDCGSTLAVVTNTDQPRYEIFGETLDRSRTLMQAAGHDTTLVSEEVFLALRPRPLRFSSQPTAVAPNLNAYELVTGFREQSIEVPTMPREEQERHTQGMVEAQFACHSRMYDTQTSEMASSMASSFSSELRSMDGDAETDSDLEWITPETALMTNTGPQRSQKYVMRQSDYDPYREPVHRNFRAMSAEDYYDHQRRIQSGSEMSDVECGGPTTSRATSRNSCEFIGHLIPHFQPFFSRSSRLASKIQKLPSKRLRLTPKGCFGH